MNTRNGLGWGLILVVLSATPAAGQSFSWGLKGGVTFANLQILATDSTLDPQSHFGLTAGVFTARDFGAGFGLQVEGLITQKGTTIRDPRFAGELKVTLAYLDVPVLVRYRLRLSQSVALQALAGAVFSLKVGDTQTIADEELAEPDAQAFTTGDLGLSVGGAVEFGRFAIDARYVFGVPNINDDIDRDELIVRTRTFAVTAGYRWK